MLDFDAHLFGKLRCVRGQISVNTGRFDIISKEISMAKGGQRAGSGRPKGAPNKLMVRRAEEIARSGKRPPAENLRVIADRAWRLIISPQEGHAE
jgi:hypothetical protein